MKKIMAALTCLLSLSSFANTLSVVKIDDGTWAHCRNKADVWRFRNQAYSVSEISITKNGDDLSLDLLVGMKQCVQKRSGDFAFELVDPMEDYFYEVPWATNGPNFVVNKTNWINFQAHRDGVYEVVLKGPLKALDDSGTIQTVAAKLSLAKLLSQSEKKALKENGAVDVSFDFYLQRSLTTSSLNNPDYSPTSITNYGIFRFNLKLESIGDDGVIIGEVVRRSPNQL